MSTAGPDSVSVVVPLFEGGRHLRMTLDSVAAQTVAPWEVIVVDDGSSDGGAALAAAHPVVTDVLRQDHLGVAVARNRGLARARGRWIAFLDQDDLWLPDRLARLVGWLGEHPDERLVMTSEVAFSTAEEIDELRRRDPVVGSWAGHVVPEADALAALGAAVDTTGGAAARRIDHLELLGGPVSVTTSFIADPDLLREAGGFAPHALAMDDYVLLVNAARICPLTRVDQPTVCYRVHLGATSRTTRLALPFLSCAVALRLGGGLVAPLDALADPRSGELHAHLYEELSRSAEFADPRVRAIARALGRALALPQARPSGLARAELRRRLPWLAGGMRTVRGFAQRAR